MPTRLPIRRATVDERTLIRHVHFRTAANTPGVVTGLPVEHNDNGLITAVRMFSAGCLHDRYDIPNMAVIEKVERV